MIWVAGALILLALALVGVAWGQAALRRQWRPTFSLTMSRLHTGDVVVQINSHVPGEPGYDMLVAALAQAQREVLGLGERT